MNKFLKDLRSAFDKVDKSYYSSMAFTGESENTENEEKKEYTQFVERVFAYELYHQYRLIIKKCDDNRYTENELKLNAEITKNGFEHTKIGKARIFPDMVLHKNQTNNDINNQVLFIEIKVQENCSFDDDIKKMIVALSDRLNYQNAVLISINHNNAIQKVKEFNRLTKIDANLLQKLWLFTEKDSLNFKQILE